jgi:DNA repair protein RecN (Recombination protein N)
MLKKLVVKDFAIIEDVTIEFDDNMTVLTGETGAGKSLIIDTISLILAARADQSMIRYGSRFAYIEGEFIEYSDNVKELLDRYGIKENGTITIVREIYDTSKNIIKINGQNVTLTILKMISSLLADLHVQNDTYRLFNKESYLSLIDPKDDDKFNKLLASYIKELEKYNTSIKEYEHILKGQKETLDRLEFLQYEKDELTALELEENIDVELEEKISKLSNFDKIFNALNEAKRCLDGEISAIDSLYDASKYMEKIASYDNEYNDMSTKLLDSYYIIDEVNTNLAYHIRNLDYDEEELDMLVSRLNEINKAKDKYKKSVNELIQYLKKITLDINMVIDYDNVLNESKNKV